MRALTSNRLTSALFIPGMLLLAMHPHAFAQADPGDAPLGDVARSFRKKPAPAEAVVNVDDDNLSKVMDDAESRRAAGAAPVFSLVPPTKGVHVSSPDVTCSLSFSATSKTTALSDPLLLDELPRAELGKLDGPATIDGDSLQVSMHNGTSWELREVLIGLTIVKQSAPVEASSALSQARIVPAAVAGSQNVPDSYQKQPDVTLLLHVKGSAAPSTTATFRTPLNFALFPDQEWHWAIVRAKGIPLQAPPEATTMMQSEAAGQPPDSGTKLSPPIPSSSNKPPTSPEPASH